MSILLEESKAIVKEAREQAYLGKYKDAISKLSDQLIKLSQQLQCLRGDPTLEPEWSRMVSNLGEELELIKILYSFQRGLIAQESPQRHPPRAMDDQYVQPKQQQQEIQQFPFNQIPFAGKRQQQQQEVNRYFDISPPKNTKTQSEHTLDHGPQPPPRIRRDDPPPPQPQQPPQPRDDEQFIANLRQPGSGFQKDPDVWDPPPPQNKMKKNQAKASRPKQQNANPFQSPPVNQGGKRRDYNKPWLANVNNGQDNKGKQDDRKRFLNHAYPDGHGPDTELIQMLEREVVDLNPNVKFEDIAELEQAKEVLQEAVLLPIIMPNLFKGIRRPLKGVMLFGPPGTGKTMLAKAVATIGKTTFFNVSASSLASKWRGESEKLVRILFEMARFYSPSTIFFDEIDALGSKRTDGEHEASRKVKTEMLIQMDGVSNNQNTEERKVVTVLAATNRPWDLDEALIRRLERRIYIPLPTKTGRKILLDINLKDEKVDQDLDWETLLSKTEGFSGADISSLCREAAMFPLRRKLKEEGGLQKLSEQAIQNFQEKFDVPLMQRDFDEALKNINKSVTNDYLKAYEKWMAEFGNA